MTLPRAGLLIRGTVVIEALPDRVETVEAIGIEGGRVVSAGSWSEVHAAARPRARVVDARPNAVIPGLHDFHVHLVGLARSRSHVQLAESADGADMARRLLDRAATLAAGEWLTGRGWNEAHLATLDTAALAAALGDRPAYVRSHDMHSAWASPAALALAGINEATADPTGGRIERDASGRVTGVLRETALDLVAGHVPEPHGEGLRGAMDATLSELAALGVTGASEAGDYTADDGVGADADLGDSASSILELGYEIDGRLRLNLGIPVDALTAAASRGLRTAASFPGRRTIRLGWAKEYADGSLGSGTAALSAPVPGGAGVGIMRVTPDELDGLFAASRRTGIGLAIHAIGDRAATVVLDALERAPARGGEAPLRPHGARPAPAPTDRPRFAELGMVASVQPIHAASDRDLVDTQWRGRESDAYAWRSLADAGALLVAGSDAPGRIHQPMAGHVRRGPPTAAERFARRLAAVGVPVHHRGAARLHDRPGAGDRCAGRGPPAGRCASRPGGPRRRSPGDPGRGRASDGRPRNADPRGR